MRFLRRRYHVIPLEHDCFKWNRKWNRFVNLAELRVRARKCGKCGYDKPAGFALD